MRTRLVVIVAALVVAALAAVAEAASQATGVRGIVLRGPVVPVCEEGIRCDVPFPGVTLLLERGGREVARTTTRSDGRFAVQVAPGSYAIRTLRKLGFKGLPPLTVRVVAGRMTRVTLHVDTGIR